MEHEKTSSAVEELFEILYFINQPIQRQLFNIFIAFIVLIFASVTFLYLKTKEGAVFFLFLPLIYASLCLCVCRSVDAGKSPWWGFLALVPGLNVILLIALAILPSHPNPNWHPIHPQHYSENDYKIWIKKRTFSFIGLIFFSYILIAIQIFLVKEYIATLFITTPLLIGVFSGYLVNSEQEHISPRDTRIIGILILIPLAADLYFSQMGGVICLIMAFPITLPIILMGSHIGRSVAVHWWPKKKSQLLLLLFLIPAHFLTIHLIGTDPSVKINTSMIVQASPEKVWKYVPEVSMMQEPDELMFKLGIAYPRQAQLDRDGLGAKRIIDFSTGTMEQVVTKWEENRKLAFSITSQPPLMVKTTLGPSNLPQKLKEFFKVQKGEIKLVPLPDGSTRLEGTSWLSVDIHPHSYWRLIVDPIVHAIHNRVFRHIKQQAESDKTPSSIEHIPIQVATK